MPGFKPAAAAAAAAAGAAAAGFSDVSTINSDPDLRPVQGPQLQAIINK
jgi:hypothetical protein